MLKKASSFVKNKSGMTLVETLTAMAILSLLIFCFAPLFLSYFKSIDIAGDRLQDTYRESGVLQGVIGTFADKNSSEVATGYSMEVGNIPLKMSSQTGTTLQETVETTVNGEDVFLSQPTSSVISTAGTAVTTAYAAGGKLDFIDANLIVSNPNNAIKGFSTVIVNSIDANFQCFPSTITDDFITKQIYIVAEGMNAASRLADFKIYVNDNPDNKDSSGNPVYADTLLTAGEDYALSVCEDNNEIIILTLYGGNQISFETSPLTVKFGNHTKEIEIDAPSLIMVGEKDAKKTDESDDDDYHYYVSSGNDFDANGNLIVIQRDMNSTGPVRSASTGAETSDKSTVKLTSAMNDVEWVPAESGDGYNIDSNSNKYGYYVMCGDNGQIRRFWRNNQTGNYYWGGDITYYTDLNNDEITASNSRYTSTKTYSTDVEYSYVYRGSHNAGFVMGGNTDLKLMNANTFTINALDSDKAESNKNIALYLPDGEVYYYQITEQSSRTDSESTLTKRDTMYNIFNADTNFNNGTVDGVTVEGLDRYWNINLATDWFAMTQTENSTYYAVNPGVTNMITLTSVGAIQLTGNGTAGAGGPYYSTTNDGAQGSFAGVEYPTSSYTLYCGYIPAVMDIWSNGHSRGDMGRYFRPHESGVVGIGEQKDVEYTDLLSVKSTLRDGGYFKLDTSDFGSWPRWKGTYGVIPYRTDDSTDNVIQYGDMQSALDHDHSYKSWGRTKYSLYDIVYYQFTNIKYALIGKAYDSKTPIDSSLVGGFTSIIPGDSSRLVIPQIHVNGGDGYNQQNVTGGNVVDITMSYLSHPLAIARTMNPTDDIVCDWGNDRDHRVYFWNNRRESATYLDVASTVVPSGENDIPVSLLVGYITGGLAEYTGSGTGDDVFVNSLFNNGIVLLRAGTSNTGTHTSDNVNTGEDKATDNTGYKLDAESNAFHQFYYLNSRSFYNTRPMHDLTTNNIGCTSGALYWFNNRHIDFLSQQGGTVAGTKNADGTYTVDSTNYNYLRCHPLANTKVTCAVWGTTWSGNPVAMWGTENGTLLSWKAEIYDDNGDGESASVCNASAASTFLGKHEHAVLFNDRSVTAEFQSYQWVDRVSGKSFAVHDSKWRGTVGAYSGNLEDDSYSVGTFDIDDLQNQFIDFFDSCSRIRSKETFTVSTTITNVDYMSAHSIGNDTWKNYGFISTLDSVNDVAYADDIWVAVGNQSGKDPAIYCGGTKSTDLSGKEIEAYSGDGGVGSYVNVCYWIDTNSAANHKQTSTNRNYQWKAVKISDDPYYNIVQINNVNGLWVATGYYDADHDDEYDNGEKPVVCWTYNPTIGYNEKDENGQLTGWCDDTVFLAYDENSSTGYKDVTSSVGGINSVATRS